MNLFGHFESLLHARFPNHELVVRNFARPCDAVDNRQRPNNYTELDDPLQVYGADLNATIFSGLRLSAELAQSKWKDRFGNQTTGVRAKDRQAIDTRLGYRFGRFFSFRIRRTL